MSKRRHIQFLRSSGLTIDNKAQAPLASDLYNGEIAVNINVEDPSIFIKDTSDNVVKFNAVSRDEIESIHNDVNGLIASVVYDSSASTINFYNQNNEELCSIDTIDFIKDGMVEDVRISGDNLEIIFNVASGHAEPILIPLSDIFNPDDYYTKNQFASVAISGSYDDLEDKPFIPTAISALTEDNKHETVTAVEKNAWNNKQDAIANLDLIVSGATLGLTAYQKPASGITINDLDENIQTSLGKADTALQEHQDISNKTDKVIIGGNGTAYIFNEADGGGAKFDNKNGIESFVGVNDGEGNGIVAQIYADKLVDGKWMGAKLDVKNNGIYYTVGNKSAADRDIPANELATKGDFDGVAKTEDLATVATSGSYNDLDNKPEIPTTLSALTEDSAHQTVSTTEKNIWNAKTNQAIESINGRSLVFNESDGGGIKYEHSDGTLSFVGVNDGGSTGITGQIYTVEKDDETNQYIGTRLSLTKNGFYYTNGASSSTYTEKDELATKGDFDGVVRTEDLATVATSGSYNDLDDKPFIPTAISALTEDDEHETVTAIEKNAWDNKQDSIVNLDNIISGATLGLTAYQKLESGITINNLDESIRTSLGKADTALQEQDITGITSLIPPQASSENLLADKNFVNSSIATSTAEFKGTYDTLAELEEVTADTNDYGFVISVDASGNTLYNRYKYNGSSWIFEYALNNSSFTAAQWAAIQSNITSALVTKLNALPTNEQLEQTLQGKQAVIANLDEIIADAASGATAYQKIENGITKNDLDESVQTSLEKADTALQTGTLSNYYTKNEVDTEINNSKSNWVNSGTSVYLSGATNQLVVDSGSYDIAYCTIEGNHHEIHTPAVNGTEIKNIGNAHVEGNYGYISNHQAHTEGFYCKATGQHAHAEGRHTAALADGAHSEGWGAATGHGAEDKYYIRATGIGAHAEGWASAKTHTIIASGNGSHAEGIGTTAQNEGEHAEGKFNLSTKDKTLSSIGVGTSESTLNAFEVQNDGTVYIKGVGTYNGTNADSGTNDIASILQFRTVNSQPITGASSNIVISGLGSDNYISGGSGADTIIQKIATSSYTSTASGQYSVALGRNNKAIGNTILIAGLYNQDDGNISACFGERNYGTGGATKALISGTRNIADANCATVEGYGNQALGGQSHAEGRYGIAHGAAAHSEGEACLAGISGLTVTIGGESYVNPTPTTATTGYTEWTCSNGTKFYIPRPYHPNNNTLSTAITLATGTTVYSTSACTASSGTITKVTTVNFAHAEGFYTQAKGKASHAEGWNTVASNDDAHAEGYYSEAIGDTSHAEGHRTKAIGTRSHAQGLGTIANNKNENAMGAYNVSNTSLYDSGTTIHSLGIGTAENNRANAFEIMQNGDVYVIGLGGYDGTNAAASGVKTLQTVISDLSTLIQQVQNLASAGL